jgi:predicted heme/steroid binding protein
MKMEIPEGVSKFNYEDLAKGDGKNEKPVYLALNGKVI